MPDVLTHLLVGASIALLVRRNDNRAEQMMIILGAILIDIERPLTWLLEGTELEWLSLGSAFHSVLGALVLSYFAAACFLIEDIDFKNRFYLIFLGCTSHLLLDMVMYPWSEHGLFLLYPLKIAFSFHLLWPDFWLFSVYGCIFFLIVLFIRYLRFQRE
jgi:hypothetical protein